MARIAGINLSKYGSLAIIDDGKVDFYLEEERVSRVKRDRGAVQLVHKYLDDVDVVTICDCYTKYNPRKFLRRTKEKEAVCKVVREKGIPIKDYRRRHHECHAANAFYNSGFDDAVVVIMDGKGSVHDHNGMRYCETETIFDNMLPVFRHYSTFWSEKECNKLKEPFWDGINFYSDRTSVGQAYRRVSRFCGFDELDAGKTMGLSAYGSGDVNLFNEEYGHSICSKDLYALRDSTEYYGPPIDGKDLAYNLQKSAEQHAIYMIKKAVQLSNKNNVVVSGGFFLNCVANHAIIKEMDINLFVDPIAYDGGISIGSALLEHYEHFCD